MFSFVSFEIFVCVWKINLKKRLKGNICILYNYHFKGPIYLIHTLFLFLHFIYTSTYIVYTALFCPLKNLFSNINVELQFAEEKIQISLLSLYKMVQSPRKQLNTIEKLRSTLNWYTYFLKIFLIFNLPKTVRVHQLVAGEQFMNSRTDTDISQIRHSQYIQIGR